jgi:hypothetical protein
MSNNGESSGVDRSTGSTPEPEEENSIREAFLSAPAPITTSVQLETDSFQLHDSNVMSPSRSQAETPAKSARTQSSDTYSPLNDLLQTPQIKNITDIDSKSIYKTPHRSSQQPEMHCELCAICLSPLPQLLRQRPLVHSDKEHSNSNIDLENINSMESASDFSLAPIKDLEYNDKDNCRSTIRTKCQVRYTNNAVIITLCSLLNSFTPTLFPLNTF